MKRAISILSLAVLLMMPAHAVAQSGQGAGASQTDKDKPKAAGAAVAVRDEPSIRFVRTLTNVQIELTLKDEAPRTAPEVKTISMIVASGNWGKIRNTAARTGPFQVGLNVDARPYVSTEGPIQVELTIYYYPPNTQDRNPTMPVELNQSLTVVLQNGKPMMISQAADPTSDRKVTIEAKATVLK